MATPHTPSTEPPTQAPEPQQARAKRPKRPFWHRFLLWLTGIVAGVVCLVIIAIAIVVWTLSPQKLTPLVEEYSSDYLYGKVKSTKIELTFWKTFPRVQLDIDSLAIISHALDSLPADKRALLPANADTLLTVRRFSGGINVMALMQGDIRLYDVEFEHPRLNFVSYDGEWANYNIVPPSTDTTALTIPAISINHFIIKDGAPVRYFSAVDSTDVTLMLRTTEIDGHEAPLYMVDVQGGGEGRLSPHFSLPEMPFGLDGKIEWQEKDPRRMRLENFTISAAGLSLTIDTEVTYHDLLTVEGFELRTNSLRVMDIIDLIPEEYRREFGQISTDIALDLKLKLMKPYTPSASEMPTVTLEMDIPKGSVSYDNVTLPTVKAAMTATIRGDDLNQSVLRVDELTVGGRSVLFTLSGTMSQLFTDPLVNGHFDGKMDFGLMPQALLRQLPFSATGTLEGACDLKLHLSQITPETFHYIQGQGKVTLRDFHFAMNDSSLQAYTPHGLLELGTNTTITRADTIKIDSLLTMKLQVDSLAVASQGFHAVGNKLLLVAAAKNIASSTDTTLVNPLGFSARGEKITLRSDSDSMRVRLTNASITASLQRYKQNARVPLLRLKVGADRLRYHDPTTHLSLRNGQVDFTLHPRKRQQQPQDSASRARRAARRDSLATLASLNNPDRELLDFEVDHSVKSWLRQWQASGHITAERGRMFTPYVPVRNTVKNLDIAFDTDSLVITNSYLRMGESDFTINGTISNIRRALTSRRGQPLRINLDLRSDTININEITRIIMASSAYSARQDSIAHLSLADNDDDSAMEKAVASQNSLDERAAFIVPANIEASLNVNAKDVLYADIWFQRFVGRVEMRDGAINLQRMAGYTPMGSMDLTALYSAPNVDDLSFAAGIVVRKLNLRRFLDMLPWIDSIMPLLNEVEGTITADCAMTTELDSMMDIKFYTLNLVLKLTGDSLVVIDNETFRTMAKWLMFKHKDRNLIDHMQVEMMIKDSRLDLFPFVFDLDRYKFGVSGWADGDLNYDYHIAVLKSPLPFKFGVNIKGEDGHRKIRLGRAHFNEDAISHVHQLSDTARINLLHEIEKVFKFGVKNAHAGVKMKMPSTVDQSEFSVADTLTHADSIIFIQGGAIEGPKEPPFPEGDN
ncbi:MAG: hypothetical protein LIO90_09130 [Bacteroidales bacterium]|nr:hypothetical protein [Bacteroidales bacterium]